MLIVDSVYSDVGILDQGVKLRLKSLSSSSIEMYYTCNIIDSKTLKMISIKPNELVKYKPLGFFPFLEFSSQLKCFLLDRSNYGLSVEDAYVCPVSWDIINFMRNINRVEVNKVLDEKKLDERFIFGVDNILICSEMCECILYKNNLIYINSAFMPLDRECLYLVGNKGGVYRFSESFINVVVKLVYSFPTILYENNLKIVTRSNNGIQALKFKFSINDSLRKFIINAVENKFK